MWADSCDQYSYVYEDAPSDRESLVNSDIETELYSHLHHEANEGDQLSSLYSKSQSLENTIVINENIVENDSSTNASVTKATTKCAMKIKKSHVNRKTGRVRAKGVSAPENKVKAKSKNKLKEKEKTHSKNDEVVVLSEEEAISKYSYVGKHAKYKTDNTTLVSNKAKLIKLLNNSQDSVISVSDFSEDECNNRTVSLSGSSDESSGYKTMTDLTTNIQLNVIEQVYQNVSNKQTQSSSREQKTTRRANTLQTSRKSKVEGRLSVASKTTKHGSSGHLVVSDVSFKEQLRKFYDSDSGDSIAESEMRPGGNPADWILHERDKFKKFGRGGSTRYFFNDHPASKIQCRRCNQRGHMMRDCSQPRKGMNCLNCSSTRHLVWRCPHLICPVCMEPGHTTDYCRAGPVWSDKLCHICSLRGHSSDCCPDLWRRYCLTTSDGPIVKSKYQKYENPRKNCYNCASKQHWGYECRRKTMDTRKVPFCPFVVSYADINNGPRNSAPSHKRFSDDTPILDKRLRTSENLHTSSRPASMTISERVEEGNKELEEMKNHLYDFINKHRNMADRKLAKKKLKNLNKFEKELKTSKKASKKQRTIESELKCVKKGPRVSTKERKRKKPAC